MTNNILQKNLARLLKEQGIHPFELERRAGLKKNNVYNIIKGLSKKPSAELIQSVANALGVSMKDLIDNPTPAQEAYMNAKHLNLIIDIIKKITPYIESLNLKLKYSQILTIISEVYNYSLTSNFMEADERFIKWTLQDYAMKQKHSAD